jgi:hypothetical protein
MAGAVMAPSDIFCPARMKICAPGLRSSTFPGTNRTTEVLGGTVTFFSPSIELMEQTAPALERFLPGKTGTVTRRLAA